MLKTFSKSVVASMNQSLVQVRMLGLVGAVAAGSLLVSGCHMTPNQADLLAQGYAQGVNLAIAQPSGDGSTCEASGDQNLVAVGCRIGFSAYRYGQILAERSEPVAKCDQYPSRVNKVLERYYHLPSLNREQAQRVVDTCRTGFTHPRASDGNPGDGGIDSGVDAGL